MTIELIHQVIDINSIDQLDAIANRVIGEVCWKTTLGYGEELTLHFGKQIPYTHPSMADKYKGTWILGTCGTAWQIDKPSGATITSSDRLDHLKQEIHQLESNVLRSLRIGYPVLNLVLNFSQGSLLTITPSVHDDEFDLPYWELFTPDHQVLKVGPKSSWSLIQSDQSTRTLD